MAVDEKVSEREFLFGTFGIVIADEARKEVTLKEKGKRWKNSDIVCTHYCSICKGANTWKQKSNLVSHVKGKHKKEYEAAAEYFKQSKATFGQVRITIESSGL